MNNYVHAIGQGTRVHRLIAASCLTKKTTKFVVHHVNGDRADNARGNLCILQNQSEHVALHYRMRVKRAGGHPFTDCICDLCHLIHSRSDSYRMSSRSWRGRICHRLYVRKWTRDNSVRLNAESRKRYASRRKQSAG
jgi:hypothetical protein